MSFLGCALFITPLFTLLKQCPILYMFWRAKQIFLTFDQKDQSDTSGVDISIQGKSIKLEDNVKLLVIKLDNKLNFDSHISDLCHKAATQLNVLKRLKSFIGFEERKLLIQSFVYSNFNYCP